MLLRSPTRQSVPGGSESVEALPRKEFCASLRRLGRCCVPGNAYKLEPWGLDLRRFARLPSRVLAVAGGIVLGAIGTVALASPASAHTAELSYQLKCGPEAGTATV